MFHFARYLRLCLAIAAIMGLVPRAGAATLVRVGNSSATAFNFMPLALGIKQGNFAKNGVDVEVVDLGGASKIYQAMIAGSIDMSLAAGTDIPFIMKGVPETGVGAIAITPALLGIVVPWNSPIHSLADLKGKKVGFSTVGSLTQWVAFAAVHKAGLTPNDITGVADGSTTPPQVAALETGQVDAQVSAVALGWNLEQQKKGRLLASASAFVGPFLLNVIYAQDDFIKQHPEAVRGFLKGWYESIAFMKSHKAETVPLAAKVMGYTPGVAQRMYDTLMAKFSTDGQFHQPALDALRASFVDLRTVDDPAIDLSKFYTTEFLPKP